MNYYVITFSKAHHKITEAQKKLIIQSPSMSVEINGSIIMQNSISEIMSEDKYWEAFPDKRPVSEKNQFEDLYGEQGSQQIRQPTKKSKELMLQGLAKYIRANKNIYENAKNVYKEKSGIEYSASVPHYEYEFSTYSE